MKKRLFSILCLALLLFSGSKAISSMSILTAKNLDTDTYGNNGDGSLILEVNCSIRIGDGSFVSTVKSKKSQGQFTYFITFLQIKLVNRPQLFSRFT